MPKNAELRITPANVRAIIKKYFGEPNNMTPEWRLTFSLIVALTDQHDALAQKLDGLISVLMEAMNDPAVVGAAAKAEPPAAPSNPIQDATPFPAGVSATVAGAPPRTPQNTETIEGDDLKPNVSSGPASNVQPIPGGKMTANGRTVQS